MTTVSPGRRPAGIRPTDEVADLQPNGGPRVSFQGFRDANLNGSESGQRGTGLITRLSAHRPPRSNVNHGAYCDGI